ncbi:MAG: hypothetical protein ACOYJA_07645 [Christensenellales bacterium]
MSRRIRAALAALLAAGMLAGCGPGAQDWRCPVTGDYELWRINSRQIVLGVRQPDGSLASVVTDYVAGYCADGRYIGLRLADGPGGEHPRYALVDTATQEWQPCPNQTDFAQACDRAGAQLGDWIDTVPAPPGACYD